MLEMRVIGAAPNAEQHNAMVSLREVPRKGDSLEVCVDNVHVYVEVDLVVWPTWGEDGLPGVYLRRDEQMSDAEWADVFVAIGQRRSP